MKKEKIFVGLSAALVLAFSLAAASNPKTTGDAGILNGAAQANITFNAINTTPTGPTAKGSLIYSDPNITYTMDVQFLKVVGNHAWFTGQVTSVTGSECCAIGNWIFYEMVDNGEPGVGADQLYGQDLGATDAVTAAGLVSNMTNPSGGPFTINDGNVQVHK